KKERKKPDLLEKNSRRRKRIANGSGRTVAEVNRLIDTLKQQKQAMKRMGTMDPSKVDPNNPLKSLQPKQGKQGKKGKGKGKGGFRI
ncbi:MAG: signal recognition particle protein, partial [Bacillota bacterium]